MIDFNSNSAFTNVYLGSFQLSRMYVGDNQVWPETTPPPTGYSDQYLTFVAEESGTFKLTKSVYYSIDSGTTWVGLNANTDTPTVVAGNKIMWKSNTTPDYFGGVGNFSSSGRFTAEGNPMSLLFGDNFIGVTDLTGKNGALSELFYWAKGLTSVENLSLPATALSENCYGSMFNGCSSLTTTPVLPATTLVYNCYNSMFYGCTNITTTPVLPAPTLVQNCYKSMFYNCTSLNSVTCLATNISASMCTSGWLYNVASFGTFTKAASMTGWGSGTSAIPNGWTVQDAS